MLHVRVARFALPARVLALLLAALPAAAQDPSITAGSGQFDFRPANAAPLTVFYHVPKDAGRDTRIVFAMHGLLRQGATVRDAWIANAEALRFIVVTPQFDSAGYKGPAGYNQGRVQTGGRVNPPATWSFQVIEEVFDAARARFGLGATSYGLFGHSAGAQFVHRFALLMPLARADRYVSANAGGYTFADPQTPYPWGLGLTGAGAQEQCRSFARPLTVVLGAADDDPNHEQLNRGANEMKQGAHRLERGRNFFAFARARAQALACPFAWTLQVVDGIGHEFDKMGAAAAPLLAAPGR